MRRIKVLIFLYCLSFGLVAHAWIAPLFQKAEIPQVKIEPLAQRVMIATLPINCVSNMVITNNRIILIKGEGTLTNYERITIKGNQFYNVKTSAVQVVNSGR